MQKVRADTGKYLAAVFKIILAYRADGMPQDRTAESVTGLFNQHLCEA
jgi:hypothetical protein